MEASRCGLPCDNDCDKSLKLSKDEIKILNFRFNFPIEFLCPQHYDDQFSRYSGWHSKKCCDPCQRHSRPMKSQLREVSLQFASKVMKKTEYRVIPGKSICKKCELFLIELAAETTNEFWSVKTDSEDEDSVRETVSEPEKEDPGSSDDDDSPPA